MGRRALNLTGLVFGKLTVVKRDWTRGNKNSFWVCNCKCGNTLTVSGINLKSGNSKSCGCTNKKLGGKSNTPEFVVWTQMIQRCHSPSHHRYEKYGGRGVNVCDHWLDSFLNFLQDMGSRPNNKYSLDRIDNDKGYFPGNCAWRTTEQQNNNRGKYNVMVTYRGETKTASQWARQYGRDPSLVIKRLRLGWDIEKCLATPSRRGKNE